MNTRETIKQAMQAQELSQRALADKSGVPQPNISDFLSGKTTVNVETLEKIMAVLELAIVEK